MPIYIDDERVELPGDDVAGVLAAARRRLDERSRVVVEVHLDGEYLSGDALDQAQAQPIGDRELRLVSVDPQELALNTLEQVRDRLTAAGELQSQAAELLQQDSPADALRKVSEAVQVWIQTQQAVLNSAMLVGIDLDNMQVGGEPVSAYTDELVERLKSLRESITSHDTVGLADALAYEWPQTTSRWETLVDHVIEQVRAKGR